MGKLMLFESWFKKKQISEVQKEYAQPELKQPDIQNVIIEYNSSKNLCIKYLTMFKTAASQFEIMDNTSKRRSLDFVAQFMKKAIMSFTKSVSLLYRLSIIKNKYNIEIDFEKELTFLGNYITKRRFTYDPYREIFPHITKSLFFLNELYQTIYDDYDYENPQFFYEYNDNYVRICWKRKKEISRKGTENIDPFQEENWDD